MLLKDINYWRKRLLNDLLQQNPTLTIADRHQVAQSIILRLVLRRICEERAIEPNHHLVELVQQTNIYQYLWQLPITPSFYSRLLSLQTEQDTDAFRITMQTLEVGDKPLQGIIQTLCGSAPGSYSESIPEHPLRTTPIEILGHLYEQFLGSRETQSRKASGIYYTPTHVVDYVIHHTISKRIQGTSIESLQDTNPPFPTLVDPACGAGSFLLSAYRFLLNWYLTEYLNEFDRYKTKLYAHPDGSWRLIFEERQRILLRHIHGVDLDRKAITLTKQSLLLTLLDGISDEAHIRGLSPLPDFDEHCLDQTIRCGNALIGSDFYQQVEDLPNPQHTFQSLHVFDWEEAFPAIMQSGGFDVVVGNPPWVFTRNVEFGDRIKQYYYQKYLANTKTAQKGKTKQTGKVNLFILFLFQCIRLVHPQGLIGIITPNTLLRTTIYDVARKHILDQCSIHQIVDLGSETFPGITAISSILILGKDLTHQTVKAFQGLNLEKSIEFPKEVFLKNTSYVFSVLINSEQRQIFEKMDAVSVQLGRLTKAIIEGIVCKQDQISRVPINAQYRKLVEGKDISRYAITFREKYILFDRQQVHRLRPDYVWAATEKIILRRIGGGQFSLIAALDTDQYCAFASTNNILLNDNCHYNIRYILALLNSRVLNYYYTQKFTNQSLLTVNISKTFIEQLPIPILNIDSPSNRATHDRIVQQVKSLRELHHKLSDLQLSEPQTIDNPSLEKEALKQDIATLDRQLDQWIYELYQLTDTEIEFIEAQTHQPPTSKPKRNRAAHS